MTTLQDLRKCIRTLEEIDESLWAETFINLRMKFWREHQSPYIFSTRFGANFFTEIEQWILGDQFLHPEDGVPLSDYDKNFNIWLKKVRDEKNEQI